MKLYYVDNPNVYIGYFLIHASSSEEAVALANKKIKSYGYMLPSFAMKANEVIFDETGISESMAFLD